MPEPTTATVYVPTLIETVEQAASYPLGTVAVRVLPDELGARIETAVRENLTDTIRWRLDAGGFPHEGMVLGWTALVPVEATVERMAAYAVMTDWEPDRPEGQMATRYTTPWTTEKAAKALAEGGGA